MAYPADLLTDDEAILKDFHPHWRVLLAVLGWALLALGGMVVAFLYADGRVAWLITAALLLGWVGLSVPPLLSWRFTQYVLTTERIIVRTGIVTKTGTEIPLDSIDNVVFHQTLVERTLGYGDLVVESTQGRSTFADIPQPEHFQQQIYKARESRTIQLGSGGGARDSVAQLAQLADLRDRGVLTEEEFQTKKRQLLEEG